MSILSIKSSFNVFIAKSYKKQKKQTINSLIPHAMEIAFWICLFIVFYTYLGYGITLYAILCIKRMTGKI